MKRALSLLLLSLLAACATPSPEAGNPVLSDAAQPEDRTALGQFGPDGGPLVADRGIGGTGAPIFAHGQGHVGAQGAAPKDARATVSAITRIADRGIGGTGVVGVVTGFGSVFVNGLEIEYDNAVAVDIDGTASSVAALRVGQLVAIRAEGPATAPYARAISVRSEVIGRIEGLELGSGTLTVAGQPVLVADGTWGANQFGLGDWVKVSGLRRGDGTVLASRLDSAPAGTLAVRGQVVSDSGTMRVGGLVLGGTLASNVQDNQFVIVSGSYTAGRGQVSAIATDTLSASPSNYFGASTNRLIVQTFVHLEKGAVSMNGIKVGAAPVISGAAAHDGLAVVSLQRGEDGSYVASDLRYAGYRGQPSRNFRGGGRSGRNQGAQHGVHSQAAAASSDTTDNGPTASGPSAGDADPANPSGASTAQSVIATGGLVKPLTAVPHQTATPAIPSSAFATPALPAVAPVAAPMPVVVAPPSAPVVPAAGMAPFPSAPTVVTITPVAPSAPVSPGLPAPAVEPESVPSPAPMVAIPGPESISSIQTVSADTRLPFSIAARTSRIGSASHNDPGTSRSESGRPRAVAVWHFNESSNKIIVSGSTAGPTIESLTGAVTSVTLPRGTGDQGAAGRGSTAGIIVHPASSPLITVSRSDATIGTTAGKAVGGGSGRPHGH